MKVCVLPLPVTAGPRFVHPPSAFGEVVLHLKLITEARRGVDGDRHRCRRSRGRVRDGHRDGGGVCGAFAGELEEVDRRAALGRSTSADVGDLLAKPDGCPPRRHQAR